MYHKLHAGGWMGWMDGWMACEQQRASERLTLNERESEGERKR